MSNLSLSVSASPKPSANDRLRPVITGSVLIAAIALSLAGCASGPRAENTPKPTRTQKHDPAYATTAEPEGTPISRLFGGGGSAKSSAKAVADAGIGVNAYLWRASLDTISFMPLTSADPWGGTIITEWYANPQKPDERFKATIFILDSRLRADALNVNINKQVQQNGQWVDSEVSAQTAIDVENAILTRARLLRLYDVKK